ncbi:MAG: acetyl-CoA decarbonylase/synthase complex subunit gamma [Candidatus Omnitrophica bacterium]|nr:acetyl-CoA decarbonylase/synthase complex subunit gamma [Candidatus Omnitrophota bacterium]
MALSGLEIYKLLPKTNCKECGFPTCLAFAMQIAAKKAALDKCPHVSEEAKGKLESASRPPINLVTIGSGEGKLEVGNETVMFRHEQTFYHPTGLGFIVEDNMVESELIKRVEKIERLRFERVGQKIEANIVALANTSKTRDKYIAAIKRVLEKTKLNLLLICDDPETIKASLDIVKDRRPLIYAATKDNLDALLSIAKGAKVPLVISAPSLEDLSELSEKAASGGLNDIVLDSGKKPISEKLEDLTYIRRLALKKTYRPFGHPTIAFTDAKDPYEEASEAATLIVKYASIVIMKCIDHPVVLSLLTARQNIFTDPQKPLQVEPKVYEIGNVTGESPVLVTTNFSLTYYTVESEVESSKVPSYIVSVDSEGMSVLTAWAAEKFTPEKITSALNQSGLKDKITHKELVLPGYVAVMSGKLQEESGWQVKVGPREASGIPSFLKGKKK